MMVSLEELTGEEIVNLGVYHAPIACKSAGFIMAGAIMVNLTNGRQCHIIITDDIFVSLKEDTKKFIICHEIGHIVNNDPVLDTAGKFIKYILLCNFSTPDIEIAADAYAASAVGKDAAIKALKDMSKGQSLLIRGQLKRRIKKLQKAS